MSMTANLLKVSKNKLAALQSDPSLIGSLVMDAIQGDVDENDFLDLYKSWNALHVLLDVDGAGAESGAVMGGTMIGEDLGYGPARILNEDAVAEIAKGLAGIAQGDFESRFDVDKMEDVYSFHAENAEEEWEILSDLFQELKSFYQTAAKQSCGMLLYLV